MNGWQQGLSRVPQHLHRRGRCHQDRAAQAEKTDIRGMGADSARTTLHGYTKEVLALMRDLCQCVVGCKCFRKHRNSRTVDALVAEVDFHLTPL